MTQNWTLQNFLWLVKIANCPYLHKVYRLDYSILLYLVRFRSPDNDWNLPNIKFCCFHPSSPITLYHQRMLFSIYCHSQKCFLFSCFSVQYFIFNIAKSNSCWLFMINGSSIFSSPAAIRLGDYAALGKKVYPNIHAETVSFHLQRGKIRTHAILMGLSTLR